MEWGRVEHFLVVRISNGSCVNPVMQIVAIHVLFSNHLRVLPIATTAGKMLEEVILPEHILKS